MAVTTRVQDVITAAYGRSLENMPGNIADEAVELLLVVTRSLRGLYSAAAKINPAFFALKLDVSQASNAWPRPANAELIFRIEAKGDQTSPAVVAGTEVVVVPLWDRTAEQGKPAIYAVGQQYYTAGNAKDPTNGKLTFWFAKVADAPSALTDTIDALWVEAYNALLELEVAIYLAIKDGRTEEIADLKAERDGWARLFFSFLEHETATTLIRFAPNFTPDRAAAWGLLAGAGAAS